MSLATTLESRTLLIASGRPTPFEAFATSCHSAQELVCPYNRPRYLGTTCSQVKRLRHCWLDKLQSGLTEQTNAFAGVHHVMRVRWYLCRL